MSVRIWLARLAGARPGLLEKTPGDVAKHTTMGGVLISTALVSSVSAFFALNSVLKLPIVLSVLIGLGWGLIILNLDRMLVLSMGRQNGFWLNVWMLTPRLMLAVVIGTVISTPMVLRVFDREIESELTTMHAEATIKATKVREEAFAQITGLEKREKELQDTIAGNSGAAVSTDPDVKAAQTAYDNAAQAYQKAEADAHCELDGTCGTRKDGEGEAYRQKKKTADDARGIRDSAKRKLDEVAAATTKKVRDASRTQADAAVKELPGVQADLSRYRTQRTEAEAAANDAEGDNTGLLARLEALSRITEQRPSGATAHWMLFLLFLSIEVLPVLSKFLAGLGTPTAYDRLLTREDQQIDNTDAAWSKKRQSVADTQSDVPMQIELHKAAAQLAAGKTAVDALVGKQTKIALRAIDVWGDLAARRSDEELGEWYRKHIGGTAAPVPAPPRPANQPLTATQTMPMRPVPPSSNGHPRAAQTMPMRPVAPETNGFGPNRPNPAPTHP